MKLPLFRKPVPTTPSLHEDNLQKLRLRLVTAMTVIILTLGGVAVIFEFYYAITQKDWLSLVVFSGAYLWLLGITLGGKRVAYEIKAASLIGLTFLLGVKIMTDNGFGSDGEVYLFFGIMMSGLLLGWRGAAVMTAVSMGAYGVIGLLFSNHILESTNLNESVQVGVNWLSNGGIQLVMALAALVSLQSLLRHLETSLNRVQTLSTNLEYEHEQLRQHSQALQRRLNQLRSAAEISRVAGSILEAQAQLDKVVQLIYERFGLFYAGVFLREENGEDAVLSAQAGEELVEASASRRLEMSGSSIVARAILLRRSRLYLDTAPQPGIVLEPFFEKTRTALALPLNHGADTIGALIVYSAQSRAFDEDDITILQGIADSLAVALVNAQLYQQGQSSLEEIRALNRQYFIQAWREAASSLQPLSHSFESELPASPDEKTSPIAVPLTLRQQSIGELILETSAPSLSPDEMAFIEAVTTQAALALENARLLEETQRRASREQLVAEIARAVRATSDIETILRSSVQRLGQALHASEAVIHLSLREEAEPGNGSHSAGR